MAQLCDEAAITAVAGPKFSMTTAWVRPVLAAVLPKPSCPESPRPQQRTLPSPTEITQAWSPPTASVWTGGSPGTTAGGTGVITGPTPACPKLDEPQQV